MADNEKAKHARKARNAKSAYEIKLESRAAGIVKALGMAARSTIWGYRATTNERLYIIAFYETSPDMMEKAAACMRRAFRRARVFHGKRALRPDELPTQFICLEIGESHHKKRA